MNNKPKYRRVLLKLSGEALGGVKGYGIDPSTVDTICKEIITVHSLGIQIGIVIGGGNIIRGISTKTIERVTADNMGMLATVINSLALQNAFEKHNVESRVLSAVSIQEAAELYTQRAALSHLKKNRIVIFAGGTGNPYFSTDTAAALRAAEIKADVLLKATKVDGVYSDDPMKNSKAKRFEKISYLDVLNKNLRVMDTTAISFCMENKLPIIVFKLLEKDNLKKVILGKEYSTLVGG